MFYNTYRTTKSINFAGRTTPFDMNLRPLSAILTLLAMAITSHAQLTINIRYTGENGNGQARFFEMN